METKLDNAIWITWEHQVRNRSMAKQLGIPCHEIVVSTGAIRRYLICFWRTFLLVLKTRPKYVFHQNPSIFLGFFLLFLRPMFRFKQIADTHNGGLGPSEGKYPLLNWIGQFVTRHVDLALVHNEEIANVARTLGADPEIIADPLPEIAILEPDPNKDHNTVKVVFVCSWSKDEPYMAVIDAAKKLEGSSQFHFYATGRAPKAITQSALPNNLTLSGFLTYDDYCRLLNSADIMIVLTKRWNSLNCGAYEALTLGKPCLLSNSQTLQSFFGPSFRYTENTPNDIAKQLEDMSQELPKIAEHMAETRTTYQETFVAKISSLKDKVLAL